MLTQNSEPLSGVQKIQSVEWELYYRIINHKSHKDNNLLPPWSCKTFAKAL